MKFILPALLLFSACGIGLRDLNEQDSGVLGDTGSVGADTGVGNIDDSLEPLGSTDVTGLVEFTMLQVACPSCFGVNSDLHLSAQAAFHTPTSGSWIG